jgi:hypothetical protein
MATTAADVLIDTLINWGLDSTIKVQVSEQFI